MCAPAPPFWHAHLTNLGFPRTLTATYWASEGECCLQCNYTLQGSVAGETLNGNEELLRKE